MNNHSISLDNDDYGDSHVGSASDTPLRADAFEISDSEKIESIKKDVTNILNTLGLDLTDDSLKGTPNRVAKMFVNEIFGGLNPKKKPFFSGANFWVRRVGPGRLLTKISKNGRKIWPEHDHVTISIPLKPMYYGA